jgi:hypothetical protein
MATRCTALALLLLALQAGCATSPVPAGQALQVPLDRVTAPELLQPAAGTGLLAVTRDSGFMGSGCNARLHVDARPVADLASSERIEVHLPAGDHVLSVSWPGAMCGGGIVEAAVVIEPTKPKRYRISFGASMDQLLQPTAF